MPITLQFDGRPIQSLSQELQTAIQLTTEDFLYVANRQKSRILDRTARGVDANEQAFAPYSTRGPYYYYPSSNLSSRQRSGAAGRAHKKIGAGKRTPLGIRFSSYGDFKRSLGRTVVDLLGPRAPHMLQAIVVKASGLLGGATIGIYGPEAERAEGHNIGAGHLPRREFFAISTKDEAAIQSDVDEMIGARIRKILE